MISLVLNHAFSAPTIAAHAAPAKTPARIMIGITALPRDAPQASPTPEAAMVPMKYCPWPPMLNTPIRNAVAAASPVNNNGVAAINVAENAPDEMKARSTIRE